MIRKLYGILLIHTLACERYTPPQPLLKDPSTYKVAHWHICSLER